MEELFRDYWWLAFPVFGMVFGLMSMQSGERRSRALMDMIKSYVDQGKDPPPELLRALGASLEDTDASWGGGGLSASPSGASSQPRGWSFVVFAAIGAGAGVAYYFSGAYVFLAAAVAMGVLAVGALGLMFFARKS